MNCQHCKSADIKKSGKDRKGHQRFQCLACKKTFTEAYERPLGDMRLPLDKALSVIQLLVEGCSIRSIERITGVEKRTILSLLEIVGERCEQLLADRIQSIPVKAVAADEIWGFSYCKEKTKGRLHRENDDTVGDAYCFVGMEISTKLVLAWHVGRRTAEDTVTVTEKLDKATSGHGFDVYTDGFVPYKDAMIY